MSKFSVILAAAGRSQRFGNQYNKKVFTLLANRPMWMYSAEAFSKRDDVGQIILVIAAEDRELFADKFAANAAMLGIQVVTGGSERADSVLSGLKAVREDLPYVAIHDAARPCLAAPWIDDVFQAAQETGAAILAAPIHATVKRVDQRSNITETIPRAGLWMAQTPQVFRTELLRSAYAAHPSPSSATDEASIVEHSGHPVKVVPCSLLNIKVTTKEDLKVAELAMKVLPKRNPFPF
ncbi:MAG: 2-C-methyl-D-erythritol 4-phosphate cytidylyltransferase [Pirellulaceae bacterium]|nr:2-C-methyl-D-erythritol 4-phosphate cytidylyltransferase [Pirellulaceae bacterium]